MVFALISSHLDYCNSFNTEIFKSNLNTCKDSEFCNSSHHQNDKSISISHLFSKHLLVTNQTKYWVYGIPLLICKALHSSQPSWIHLILATQCHCIEWGILMLRHFTYTDTYFWNHHWQPWQIEGTIYIEFSFSKETGSTFIFLVLHLCKVLCNL